MTYLDYLDTIAAEDAAGLKKAQISYGDSWKKRGGVGAFMMLARKWDRIEKRLAERPKLPPGALGFAAEATAAGGSCEITNEGDRYDIFVHIRADTRAEGLIDDIRDLRRYLMLVEAEARASGAKSATSTHRDNARPIPLSVLKALKSFVNLHVGCSGEHPEVFYPSDARPEEKDSCEALVEAGWMVKNQEGRVGFYFTEASKSS